MTERGDGGEVNVYEVERTLGQVLKTEMEMERGAELGVP